MEKKVRNSSNPPPAQRKQKRIHFTVLLPSHTFLYLPLLTSALKSISCLSALYTHTHTHTLYIPSGQCTIPLPVLTRNAHWVTCQRPWLHKSHRSIKITYVSYELFHPLFFPLGARASERKERNVKGPFAKFFKKNPPNPPLDALPLPPTSCYLALRKMTFFSWPPSPWRSPSSLQEVGHWLIPLPW